MGGRKNPHAKTFSHPLGKDYGCCLCGRRSSTSRFVRWDKDDHVKKDGKVGVGVKKRANYLLVYGAETVSKFEDRMGHICNPCILKFKRQLEDLVSRTQSL
ncbi:hypothetical protein BaRGS_00008470 [Batillaria attramentaria]|uniref:Uncharacterized protein n=1 Tax=Batillaria attramentaria TaxID=370345 RepID=A0ABD0LMJ0_9CAEN